MAPVKIFFRKKEPVSEFSVTFPDNDDDEGKKSREPDASRTEASVRLDNSFNRLSANYININEAHLFIVPFIMANLYALQASVVNKDLQEILDEHGSKIREEEGEIEYEIPQEEFGKVAGVLDQIERTLYASEAYSRSLIIQLSTSFDIIIAGIIEQIVLLKPSVLEASERRLDFIDVDKYENIQDLKNFFVEKAVDSVVRRGGSEQFAWISDKLGIPLTKNLDGWGEFIEINERRNLFTHTEGHVTKDYIENCVRAGCKRENLSALGDILDASPKYVRRAGDLSFVIGLKLIQVVWRKLSEEYCGGFVEEADRSLIMTIYDLNKTKKQKIASQLGSFACGEVIKRYASDTTRRMFHINYAASLMLQDKPKEVENVLARLPWDAVGPEFSLSVAAIKGDIDEVCRMLPKAVKAELISKRDLQEWPLFFEVRKHDKFKTVYGELFRETFIPRVSNKQIGPAQIADLSTQMQRLAKHFESQSIKKSIH